MTPFFRVPAWSTAKWTSILPQNAINRRFNFILHDSIKVTLKRFPPIYRLRLLKLGCTYFLFAPLFMPILANTDSRFGAGFRSVFN